MAEEQHTTNVPAPAPAAEETEIKDRGLFDFLGKKEEEKPQEEVISTKLDQVHISESEDKKEDEEEKKHTSLLEKMQQHDGSSSSSSSSEEEVEEGGEKIRRKKKKGLKEKIQEKISGEKEEDKKVEAEDTSIPIEKVDHGVTEQPE
ncbi:hypothetical protein, partial [Ralstonia pseudosolanacearum]|uniref:hypothetical protein n=1 Tax=Ralstonia pseudosolanacearum TaxID=1310165 RepID=UPI003CF490D4